MKKLRLGVKGVKEILSREELKKIIGGIGSGSGGGGCVRPCHRDPGVGEGNACVTKQCTSGKCGYGTFGIWGCG